MDTPSTPMWGGTPPPSGVTFTDSVTSPGSVTFTVALLPCEDTDRPEITVSLGGGLFCSQWAPNIGQLDKDVEDRLARLTAALSARAWFLDRPARLAAAITRMQVREDLTPAEVVVLDAARADLASSTLAGQARSVEPTP